LYTRRIEDRKAIFTYSLGKGKGVTTKENESFQESQKGDIKEEDFVPAHTHHLPLHQKKASSARGKLFLRKEPAPNRSKVRMSCE